MWNLHYGDTQAAKATVDHILSYMRSIPSWAYNGGARAADSGNNGKWMPSMGTGKPDRGQMHYRSGLNMIPLLEYYRQHPEEEEFFLLEVAMGAIGGQLTNSTPDRSTPHAPRFTRLYTAARPLPCLLSIYIATYCTRAMLRPHYST